MSTKLTTLAEAVRTLVRDGDQVVLGAGLEQAIPFAAAHEIIRQGKRNLTSVAPISDMVGDMLIGAGCIAKVVGAWMGNVSAGLGHNYRRAVEQGLPHPIAIEDYSNFTLALALWAGAYGAPYVPVRTILGSDIMASNPKILKAEDPYTKTPIALIPPLRPDVAFLSVQRAAANGDSHVWGNLGVMQEAGMAAERVILLADQIVAPEVIASDPNRVIVPGFRVAAVVHTPCGQHPSPLAGHWKRDGDFFTDYHRLSRESESFQAWLKEWVFEPGSPEGYLAKLGERVEALRIREQALSVPANYGAS